MRLPLLPIPLPVFTFRSPLTGIGRNQVSHIPPLIQAVTRANFLGQGSVSLGTGRGEQRNSLDGSLKSH